MSYATQVEWEQNPGKTTAVRVRHAALFAKTFIDYMILPTEPTIDHLEQHVGHVFAHTMTRRLNTAILQHGQWQPISEVIQQSPIEAVQVYQNAER